MTKDRTGILTRLDHDTLAVMEKARGKTGDPKLESQNTFVQIAIRERSERILKKGRNGGNNKIE